MELLWAPAQAPEQAPAVVETVAAEAPTPSVDLVFSETGHNFGAEAATVVGLVCHRWHS